MYESHIFQNPNLKIIFHYDEMSKRHKFHVHWHRNPELLLGMSGEGVVSLDGKEVTLKAGEIVIINSQIHQIQPVSDSVAYWCLILSAESFGNPNDLPDKTSDPQIIKLYHAVIREFNQKSPYYEETIKGYLASLLSLLRRQYLIEGAPNPNKENSKVQIVKRTLDYIHENFTKPLSTATVAAAIGLSKYYLCHLFKEETGKTIFEYLLFVRCRNARELIRNTKCSVAEAAYESGFSNLSYFSKVYFRTFASLPSEELKKRKRAEKEFDEQA